MNLNTTLTTRDKKLLYMLVFIVILFLFGWCLIRPLYKKTVEDQERITIESSLKTSNESKVIGLSAADALTEKFSQDIAETTSVYYDYMDSSEIDKLVTSYILKKGLLARDLTITMPTGYVMENPYVYSDVADRTASIAKEPAAVTETENIETKEESEEDKIKSSSFYKDAALGFLTGYHSEEISVIATPMESYADGSRNASTTESSKILCVELSIIVEGDADTEQAIIDDLSHNTSLRVTGFNWITVDPVTYLLDDGSVVIVESETKQLQISVNLYMKDKAE